jgi:hypothetical protein
MLVPALRRFLPLLGSRPPQLTGSDDEIERLHPHGATRLKRQCELAQSGVRPNNFCLSNCREIGGAADGVTDRVVEVVGGKGLEQHPDGRVRRLDIRHGVGIGGHAEEATPGRYRLSVSET